MSLLRSVAFHAGFYSWTCVICVFFSPFLPFSRRYSLLVAEWWSRGSLFLLRIVVGCRYRIEGLDHLPGTPVIIACKHQSAWETVAFHSIISDPAFVLKKALADIPLYGAYVRKLGMVALDRAAGASAMRGLIRQSKRAVIDQGRSLVIFPEGTRAPPGRAGTYHPGIAALYTSLGVPVVPASLNSGLVWPRRGLIIRPGVITLKFLPPIAPGLERRAFMKVLEERIERASDGLPPPQAEVVQPAP